MISLCFVHSVIFSFPYYHLTLCLPMRACSVVFNSLQPHGLQPARLLCPWDFPGKNTERVCHFLLHGIFLTQRSYQHLLCLLHWQVGSKPLGKPVLRTRWVNICSEYCLEPNIPNLSISYIKLKKTNWTGLQNSMARTSLVVQWLRIHPIMHGTMVQSLVRELRSHMPWGS